MPRGRKKAKQPPKKKKKKNFIFAGLHYTHSSSVLKAYEGRTFLLKSTLEMFSSYIFLIHLSCELPVTHRKVPLNGAFKTENNRQGQY